MVEYRALNVNPPEIRLLKLLPGKDTEPIQCRLYVVSLQDNPIFEALSYVWGDAKNPRPIELDNDAFHVTANLEEGLRALRSRRKTRIL